MGDKTMSATEDKQLHERVGNLEAQLKEGLDNIKAQIDRLEQISKKSAAQLTWDVNKTLFANFAQLLEHGSTMFHNASGQRHVPDKAAEAQEIPSDEEKGANSGKKRRRRKKVKRDPNKPKRPPSAYILFCADARAKLSEEEKKDNKGAFQRFGKMWREDVSKEVKDSYIKKAKPLKEQYRVDFAAYKAKNEDSTAEPNPATTEEEAEPTSAPQKKRAKKQQATPKPFKEEEEAAAEPAKEEEEAGSKAPATSKQKKKRNTKKRKKKRGGKNKKSKKKSEAA